LRLVSPEATPPSRVLDLGAGGGLPGAVLYIEWPATQFVWLDAAERSQVFLELVVARLDASSRVAVARGRAEDLGRSAALRGSFDVVVARSFGRPAMTAECAAPFLVTGGHLVVSEPPGTVDGRWSIDGLAGLGLELAGRVSSPANFQVFRQVVTCPPEFPRRSGRPGKRPLF
jgi:16S rRNA (guanine527-N7)-methyltransferase